jgi:rSAM/selenodomain-associated transferase 2
MTSAMRRESGVGVSVIVPTLDEASGIGATIEALYAHAGGSRLELIVADGGSVDETCQIARSLGALVMASEPGRGRQMNAGAAAASGEVLLFLHADTLVPKDYLKHILETLAREGVVAGAFELGIDAPNRSLRWIEWFVNLRSRWLSLPYGDQGLFMRAETFQDLGGFADLPAMEDYELVRRLAKRGRVRLAPARVKTSARRWLHQGVLCATMVNQACIIGYYLGMDTCRLAAWRDGRCTHSRDTDRQDHDADSNHRRGGVDRQGSA